MKSRSLLLGSIVSLALFVLLTIAVKSSGPLNDADLQAALWFNQLNLGQALDWIVVSASVYGREYFWVVLVAVMLLFGDKRTRLVALGLCGVFLVGIVAGEAAKEIVARQRPVYALTLNNAGQSGLQSVTIRLPLDTDFSFPSGHALIVSIGAIYSLVAFKRKWVASLLTFEAAVVCFSRVYTFEHYPTDVLAGVALGAAIALGGVWFMRTNMAKVLRRYAGEWVGRLRAGPLVL